MILITTRNMWKLPLICASTINVAQKICSNKKEIYSYNLPTLQQVEFETLPHPTDLER